MDKPKQDQNSGGQDSDDLIAELARLVAQDARNAGSEQNPRSRVEPSLNRSETTSVLETQTPRLQNNWEPDMRGEGSSYRVDAPRSDHKEPSLDFRPETSVQEGQLPEFDFGFGERDSSVHSDETPPLQEDTEDPIAALIADAEGQRDESDQFEDTPGQVGALGQDWASEPEFAAPTAPTPSDVPAPSHPQTDRDLDLSDQREVYERDPLAEIEALIGEAAKVSMAANGGGERKVRSSFLSPEDEAQPSHQLASSASLANFASAGSHRDQSQMPVEPQITASGSDTKGLRHSEEALDFVGFGEAPIANASDAGFASADMQDNDVPEESGEELVDERVERRRRGGISAIALPALLGSLILVGAAGVYFTFFATEPEPGEAPVLSASNDPIRVDPEPVTNTTTASESIVFNELDGGSLGEQEVLVSRDQTDGENSSAISQIISAEEGETGLANRPVRTVTVRPDGTIVTSEDSMAGGSVLPVDRPDVPTMPESSMADDPIGQAIVSAMGTEGGAIAEVSDNVLEGGEGMQSLVTDPGSEQDTTLNGEGETNGILDPVAESGTQATEDAANGDDIPRPVARPEGLSVSTTTAQQPASPLETEGTTSGLAALQEPTAPGADATGTPTTTANTGQVGAWVQLSSQRSEEVARAGMAELQARYGSLFNGGELEVSRVDLGERGIYYRVRLGQPTMSAANSVCQAIQGQGGDCFVLNN